MDDVNALVGALSADPLYQLSTAGQELFHTNMLYWLATHFPMESSSLWKTFDINPPIAGVDGRGPIVREWQHIDLYIDSGLAGRKLVLENKVLAIATKRQLLDYHSKLRSNAQFVSRDPRNEVTRWCLLSLLPPTFALPTPWSGVTYAQLLPALHETATLLPPEQAGLMASYSMLVRKLVDLADAFDPEHQLDTSVELPAGLTDSLRDARLLAVVRKLRASRCAALISSHLRDVAPDLPDVDASLTNTLGIVEFYVATGQGSHIGWQIQGDQVRLALLPGPRGPKTAQGRDRMASERSEYFLFDLPPHLAQLLTPYGGKKEWLGYGHEFVYRYQRLKPGVTWQEVIELGVHLSLRTAEHARK